MIRKKPMEPSAVATSAAFSEVFITGELARRAPKRTNYLQEKIALQDLAARMTDGPAIVLPRFVELAMQMTGGISAGVSLYEPEPAPGVFRWHHVCGTLKVFEGSLTPRDDSPCGITLDQASPVLTRHSERLYKWISDANIVVPEVLLVPLFLGGPEPLGTLWIVSDTEEHFDSGHARVATELATFVGTALRMQRSEERLRVALETQEVLTREMSHRLKNVFALTASMVRLAVKGARDKHDLAQTVSGRLQALASAHALVLPGLGDGSRGSTSSDLKTLLTAVVRPHEDANSGYARCKLTGPQFDCDEHAVSSIALIIHELATNAAKYGALTSEAGCVDLSWRFEDELLVLRWIENGGPSTAAPSHAGFGSELVQGTVEQLGGTLDYDWQADGVAITISLPIKGVGARRILQ